VGRSVDYERHGIAYSQHRRADHRIAARIHAALGDARTVVNVGAGQGAYEPRDRDVTAVEPSAEMIAARPPGSAPAVQASAEALPFPDGAFDAAMAVLTIHHWSDWRAGFAELRRVARRRVVILTFDPRRTHDLWLVDEYLPELADVDADRFPLPEELGEVTVVEVPHDCRDGFMGAFWRRPERYLDPDAQQAISSLALLDTQTRERGLAALAADLESGAWASRHADLLERDALDLGYRLVVAYA
jgi:SAM-dependent methyltransferase